MAQKQTTPRTRAFRRARVKWRAVSSLFEIEPLVYGTVIVLTVLLAADEHVVDDYGDATGLVLGPMLATMLAHLFASSLGFVHRHHRAPDRAEVRHLVRHAGQFLWLTVLPLMLLAIGRTTGTFSAQGVLDAVVELGFWFLVVLGGLGGWHASPSARWLGVGVGAVGAVVIGMVLVVLKAVLEH
ncbi:hypothetical protein [Rhodococcus sp. UNC23MFCrub1.1]|uniref:hypothetical protein n=1 Tax=Rhodococcus sp. UNC23MFCrub1.1 TaxID=1449068 RepID=UPI000481A3AD|nr:hypothetical protein [Rhodococcus sp. UNC23MFCrub1.1]